MLYDITPPVTPSLAVWPGDTPMSRDVLLDMQKGDNITLSTLRATVHLGAHADAPSHYGRDGETIEQRALEPYLGPAQIIGVDVPRGQRITPAHLPQKVNIREKRVLFKTGTFPDPNQFNTDFAALSPELIDMLAKRGVVLLGIDTPSVDTFDSKDLPAHHALLRNNLAVLEGIDLSQVPFGRYEMIALPLKLVGFDASPVRAVLRTFD